MVARRPVIFRRISLHSGLLAAAWRDLGSMCGMPGTAGGRTTISKQHFRRWRRIALRQCRIGVTSRPSPKRKAILIPWRSTTIPPGSVSSLGACRRRSPDAWAWIGRGDSVDLGLMQINSANLDALDMTGARPHLIHAFHVARWRRPSCEPPMAAAKTNTEEQAGAAYGTLTVQYWVALSRHHEWLCAEGHGKRHGPNRRQRQMTPAWRMAPKQIRTRRHPGISGQPASYAQSHGAAWLVSLGPSPYTGKPVGLPAPASADDTRLANNQSNLSTQPTRGSP